jgi:CheY-like chemotaxis protein/HPt (histidine-containing phosphotransfer) domain-containing protein
MKADSIPVRVLVVDDDAMSRELLGVLLEAEGYAVETADSGEAALALIQQGGPAPGVVLADVQMPGLSGARLAGKLRRACGERTLLLAISGSQPPDKAVASFDGFLLKPFKIEAIGAALAGRRERTAAAAPAKREKWVVVAGPARTGMTGAKLVSIAASVPNTASKKGMDDQVEDAPAGESISGVPVLNEKIYRQLAASMPAPQMQEMYAMCLNDARLRIATMRRLADEQDAAKFVREAHSIKGSCGMLGAAELHGMAAELEKKGLAGAAEVNSLDELAAACDRLERMLGSRV